MAEGVRKMKSTGKRILSILIIVMLAVSVVSMNGAATGATGSIEAPMEIKILRGYSGYAVGTNAADGTNVSVGGSGETAVISQTFGGLGAVNSVTLSAASGLTALASNYELKYPNYPNTADLEGVMLYVKLPRDNEWPYSRLFFNFVVEASGAYQYIHWGVWSKGNNHVSVLSRTGSEWEDVTTDDGGNITLAYGFEGYVRFLFSDLNQATQEALALSGTKAIDSTVKFRAVGGSYGDGKVAAVYGITQNSDSVAAVLNNDIPRVLTTGREYAPKDAVIAAQAMKGFVMQDFNAFAAGDNIGNSCIFSTGNNAPDFAATAIAGIGGFDNTPAMQMNASSSRGFAQDDPAYTIKYPDNTYVDDMEAILMYIKCPAPLSGHPGSRLFFNLYSTGPEGLKWTNLGTGAFKYMARNSTSWTASNALADGIFEVPDSFEGYVLIDVSDFGANAPSSWAGRMAIESSFRFSALGDTYGAAVIQSVYCITDMGTDNTLITLNGTEVHDLANNETVLSYTNDTADLLRNCLLNPGTTLTDTQKRFLNFAGEPNLSILDLLGLKEYLAQE